MSHLPSLGLRKSPSPWWISHGGAWVSDTHHEGLIKSERVRASGLLETVNHDSGDSLRQKGAPG